MEPLEAAPLSQDDLEQLENEHRDEVNLEQGLQPLHEEMDDGELAYIDGLRNEQQAMWMQLVVPQHLVLPPLPLQADMEEFANDVIQNEQV